MKSKLSLVSNGLFPETLPPCFDSSDSKRAFRGIIGSLAEKKYYSRPTEYTRLNGTKHNRSRRFFGTPNIISYYYVSGFIYERFKSFSGRFASSPYSVSAPEILPDNADRAVKVASLSELSPKCSTKLGHSPIILKTDISQFFPSIYTHSIPWSAHGKEVSKNDTSPKSKAVFFNLLDLYVRNCQASQTRGVLIGPDAFRLIAEFISCGIDMELSSQADNLIVGAVRHVDDYYIGLRSEADALVVLSKLRDILADNELQLNDQKTIIYNSLKPINDLWAQQIRRTLREIKSYHIVTEDLEYALDSSFEFASQLGSDSPVKMIVRGLDAIELYKNDNWRFVESYLQRIIHFHPHAIDYVCLLVVKRHAIGGEIDRLGWEAAVKELLNKHIPFSNHHEVLWLLWLLLCCDLNINETLVERLVRIDNAHINAMLIQAFIDGRIAKRPRIKFLNKLASSDAKWLVNLQARSCGFTKASFGGSLADEFEHLSKRKIRLVDIQAPLTKMANQHHKAISRTRYGYDDDDEPDEIPFDDDFG